MDRSVLYPEIVNIRPLGCVEVACLKSLGDGTVFQFVGLDHGPGTKGIPVPIRLVVVVICSQAENPPATPQQRIVGLWIIIFIAHGSTTVVADLHGIHAFVLAENILLFQRPAGVIIGQEKTVFLTSAINLLMDSGV